MHLLRNLLKQMRYWDAPSRWALIMAFVLFIFVTAIGLTAEQSQRLPFLIGSIGLIIAMQIIVMWGNRHMVTPYYAAQRAYLDGDLEKSKQYLLTDITEHEAQNKSVPVDTLVLLGNVHRQLGELEESAECLQRALQREPEYHFPLYGYGRTLLVMAEYTQAADYMQQALTHGAPPTIKADVLYAHHRAGDVQAVQTWLQQVTPAEPYRNMMVDWIAHRTLDKPFNVRAYPPEAIDFWRAEANRHKATHYGRQLQADLDEMLR